MSDLRGLPQSISLTGNVTRTISAPRETRAVNVINEGVDVLKIFFSAADAAAGTNGLSVQVGWDRGITLPDRQCWARDEVAFYLKTPQTGTITLFWL